MVEELSIDRVVVERLFTFQNEYENIKFRLEATVEKGQNPEIIAPMLADKIHKIFDTYCILFKKLPSIKGDIESYLAEIKVVLPRLKEYLKKSRRWYSVP